MQHNNLKENASLFLNQCFIRKTNKIGIMTSYFYYNNCNIIVILYRLTQLLEDVQKVLSINIDESDEETLAKVAEDFSTIQNLWTKVQQQSAEQTLTGRHLLIFWLLSGDEKQIEIHCGLSVKNVSKD